MPLNGRNYNFAKEVLKTQNPVQAALNVGYAPQNAAAHAEKLMRHPLVLKRIKQLKEMQTAHENQQISSEVKAEVSSEVEEKVSSEVEEEVFSEVTGNTEEEVSSEVEEEVSSEVEAEEKLEPKEEAKLEPKAEEKSEPFSNTKSAKYLNQTMEKLQQIVDVSLDSGKPSAAVSAVMAMAKLSGLTDKNDEPAQRLTVILKTYDWEGMENYDEQTNLDSE